MNLGSFGRSGDLLFSPYFFINSSTPLPFFAYFVPCLSPIFCTIFSLPSYIMAADRLSSLLSHLKPGATNGLAAIDSHTPDQGA
ncbi:hypothetical protein ACN42_g8300 [Penicillium freii]|uniref:Uncharacterized protein n=1 Tax=Penicillium freii TaxID=48697 RepID=A0A101MDZ9_PENFR|nr:hypothetical protein ACN42_g8300 [Penicillium freii]